MSSLDTPFNQPGPPPPPPPTAKCPDCQSELGSLQLCGGMGEDIHNYNRWYQKCTGCSKIIFHGPKTPLESIPEDVQMRYTLNQSLRSSSGPSGGILCGNPECAGQRNGRPRRANKDCARVPPLCSTCCLAESPPVRCKAHRLSAAEVPIASAGSSSTHPVAPSAAPPPVINIPATGPSTVSPAGPSAAPSTGFSAAPPLSVIAMPAVVASSSSTPPTGIPTVTGGSRTANLPVPTVTVKSYARPLPDDYAKPWIAAHKKKAAQAALVDANRQLQLQVANTVKVTIWTTASPQSPCKLQVATPHANLLVIGEHDCLVTALALKNAVIEVLNCTDGEWYQQPLDLPISIPPTRRVLLRTPGLQNTDCGDFATELSAALGSLKRPFSGTTSLPGTPTKVRKFTYPAGTPPRTPSSRDRVSSASVLQQDTSLLPRRSPSPILPLAVPHSTPASTVVSHVAVNPPTTMVTTTGPLRDIKPIPFPLRYVCEMDAGMQQGGLADDHLTEPKERFSQAFPGQVTMPVTTPEKYEYRLVKLEWYEGWGTQFGSRFTPETERLAVSVTLEPQHRGTSKDVYYMTIPEGPPRFRGSHVAKKLRIPGLPPDWRTRFHNEPSIHFHEAQRVARAGDIICMFVYEASLKGVAYAFEFVPTYIVTSVRAGSDSEPNSWIVQKQLTGDPFPSARDSNANSLLSQTMATFGHYALVRHGVLFDNFKGTYMDQKLIFYSCRTNSAEVPSAYIDDGGAAVINGFVTEHECNNLCMALNLAPLSIITDPDVIEL
ncbi:hypothetical protein C2E23DRAFT_888878 [Lenzites betulinus]|nr:hypothetical protein C2E23DRAFT_888878 [Lenzites betulinus]